MKSSNELRRAFLDYFKSQDHLILPGSPLVPRNDPTLLFTNAGMVQFKDVFLGLETPAGPRAATAQRCVRAGGKHNDLENVGYTTRHHTFFEMLGNFSFGDYFKRDAIRYAWELLTVVYKLPADRLWVTVYAEDEEAYKIWTQEVKVPLQRVVRIGDNKGARYASDNFWMMGDTGPCGPCTEIFYDHGAPIAGGPPGSEDADGDRYVEIWNLVFMQFNRDEKGVMHSLPNPSVDTGMGLERLAAVIQGVNSNYDIDLFRNIIKAIADMAGSGADRNSMQVIADHIRSSAFLVTDGVLPSNEGRGYVLRRIIRRALRHGHKLGLNEPFFHKLVAVLDRDMGEAYAELHRQASRVSEVIRDEEVRFSETLSHGMKHLEQVVAKLSSKVIPGKDVFLLYDTYGFPADLTADFARERGLSIDSVCFEREMAAQRDRARAASQFTMTGMEAAIAGEALAPLARNFVFSGYETTTDTGAIRGLFVGGQAVERVPAGAAAAVVLDRSPFYAESGGQMGDKGGLRVDDGEFEVFDTRKQGGTHIHYGVVKMGALRVGDRVEAEVDGSLRQATRLNHSATHLLHAALRKVLGDHVTQKGSLVAPDRLRFDFSHHQALSSEQMLEIENMVNAEIRANREVCTRVMPVQKAIESGAMALFGEKYDSEVRVLNMGDFSVELCGGTHAARTGDIGVFKIISESGVASGVRRIEALTGAGALAYLNETEQQLRAVAERLRGNRENVLEKAEQLLDRQRQQDKEIQALKGKLASGSGGDLSSKAIEVAGIKVLAARLDGADAAALRDTADQLKHKLGSVALVLGSVEEDRVRLVAAVSKDLTGRVKAGELVNAVAQQVGGKGGGRPDMAEAGGKDASRLDAALDSVQDWVRQKLSS